MAHITEADFALAAEDLVFHAMHKINKVRKGLLFPFWRLKYSACLTSACLEMIDHVAV
jgi:hypothetical protein